MQSQIDTLLVAERQVDEVVTSHLEYGRDKFGISAGKIGPDNGAATVGIREGRGRDIRFVELLLSAELQTLHHRAHAQVQRADIVDIIDLQQGETLALAVKDVMGLVDDEGIGTAAEGGDHHEMHVVWAVGHIVRRFEDTVGVGPLCDGHQLAIDGGIFFAGNVLRDHINAHVGNAVRDFVLDDGVGVVGTPGQNDHHAVFLPGFRHDFHRLIVQLLLIFPLRDNGRIHGFVGCFAVYS